MKTKKNKKTVTKTFTNVINTTKKVAKQTNELALNTTEDVVTGTITALSQWQKVADKALKGGLKLMANQQDLVFNTLDIAKGQLVQSKKRFSKIFA